MRGPIAAAAYFAIAIVTMLTIAPANSARAKDLDPKLVRQGIDRAINYLKSRQRSDGTWREWKSQKGSITSLCALALLNAGVEPDDKNMAQALTYLRQQKLKTTYTVSLQTMVLCQAEPKKDHLKIVENVKWLVANQVTSGRRKGAWSYPPGSGDNSNAQFALLALHEAERVGAGPSDDWVWRLAKAYWEGCQNDDGSWGYYEGLSGTGSMTCAGLASLIITSDKVQDADAMIDENGRICCCRKSGDDDRMERALRWLGRNMTVEKNPQAPAWHFYYLYGIERIGRLTARRFIGTPGRQHDWYREGADYLLSNRLDSMSGFIKGEGPAENDPLISTSLALLFLSKGRRPVLMAKLKHMPHDDWNQHRGDVAKLTRFVESRWDMDLTHQVIDLDAARVEDLLQAPVLYLCGSLNPLPRDPEWQEKTAKKLRDYLDRGGFIFAEDYCGGSGFDGGFRKLMKLVFPEPEYRLRLLEGEHPVWHAEIAVNPKQVRPLYGIDFGCRTSVVYAPADPPGNARASLSCLWELSRAGRNKKYSPRVQEQIDAALAIGTNILTYATNREVLPKDRIPTTIADSQTGSETARGTVYIAKLRHPGGCNSAPRALVNLVDAASDTADIPAAARKELLAITDRSLFDHHLVFMHGRNRFRLTKREREQLKTYIERGGMLLADSICASSAFTESFRREMAAMFPENKLQEIPADDPILSQTYGGFDLKTVSRRDPGLRGGEGPLKASVRQVPPQLQGLKLGDRWAVVFSPYDISCALEKHDSLECRGYTRQDAARIGINVVLYSLQQ